MRLVSAAASRHAGGGHAPSRRGIILLVVGCVTGISVLWTIGIILALIGAVL
ncbi:hypothetical protein ACIGO6_09325 [Streptomyces sp. NPDC053750]|uniref:hypothetical protein n=1 Tax=Streptomyces sp. NPDC053750 TaxID=3365714 RepID=UPI0037CF302C